MSELALGTHGHLLEGAFVLTGALVAVLSLGLRMGVAKSSARALAFSLLFSAALGMAALSLFPADPGGALETVPGRIHATLAALTFSALSASLLAWAMAFRRDPRWAGASRPALVLALVSGTGILTLTVTGLFPWVLDLAAPRSLQGLVERVTIGADLACLLTAAIRLGTLASLDSPANSGPVPSPVGDPASAVSQPIPILAPDLAF